MARQIEALEKDISQTNFDIAVLIDRLTARTFGAPTVDTEIDPEKLRNYFEQTIFDLQELRLQTQNKCLGLQAKCKLAERVYREQITKLRQEMHAVDAQFQELNGRVSQVAGKVVHLGDQLERKNAPRERIVEAMALIQEFYRFLDNRAAATLKEDAEEALILEAAQKMQKLSTLCLELPDDDRFLSAKQRVTVSREKLEMTLMDKFRKSYAQGDTASMTRIVGVVVYSKNYTACVEIFIEESLKNLPAKLLPLESLGGLCETAEKQMTVVFTHPEAVMGQLLQALFTRKLKPFLLNTVKLEMNSETYLPDLYNFYLSLDRLVTRLSGLTLVTDTSLLAKHSKELLSTYLAGYMQREIEWLKSRLAGHLQRYYESEGHQKRPLHQGGIADQLRDWQARFNIGQQDVDPAGADPMLLSQEVTVNILDDTKMAAKRCKTLSQPTKVAENGQRLFDLLVQYLIEEHTDYGIALALHAIHHVEVKTEPRLRFFEVAHEANSIYHFFDKTVNDAIFPLMSGHPCQRDCMDKRSAHQRDLEAKLNLGLERCLTAVIGHTHHLLTTEQRKTDFRLETGDQATNVPAPSQACEKVVGFITRAVKQAEQYLDGQNLEAFLSELGMKFNRTLVDHFYSFTYSDLGGFVAMHDVTCYRETARLMNSSVVNHLFDTLLKLMNLMVMKAQNLKQVVQEYQQSGISKDLLVSFIQLRADYKTAKNLVDLKD